MNKIEYLNALKEALKNIDISVMEEIVSDYEEHFQVGKENGKTEDEICESLGSIDDLVKEINEVYNTRNDEHYTQEEPKNKQGDSTQNAGEANNADGSNIQDAISHILDSASGAINQALNAASEAINKVDLNEISNRIKDSMDNASSHLNDLTDNYFTKNFYSFDMNNINTEFTHDNITKSYDNFGPENRKINIVVNGICAEIHVKKSTNDKINIRYENNGNERQKQKYSFYSFMEDDTVYAGIRVVGRSVFMFNLKAYSIDIHIEVPENIGIIDLKTANGDISIVDVASDIIYAQTSSGDIASDLVNAGDIKIKSSSGDLHIEDCNCLKIMAETISGDIDAININAKELLLKSTSGDVDAENTKADIIDYRSLSGSLDIKSLNTSECLIKSISGDVELRDSTMNYAEISSVSGDIDLSNTASDKLRVKSTSGDTKLDANVRRCYAFSKSGNVEADLSGDVVLESSSTSGNVRVRLNNYGNGYFIKSKTVSGNLSIHYNDIHQRNLKTGTYTYGNQGSELILSSISGNIEIRD
ncbi:MAG: DUF4097 family beta strand repeat protein [Clostridiaceae bacterium]|jgi:flagellar hook-basal body complex protein FliE|nr:DUF4097 family beta strand repeat protein [Clostridiaceae bacterium]